MRRYKVTLAIGNTEGVAQVDDRIEVATAEKEATYHTLVSGDTLSKIAKAHYGDAMKYPVIFEANKPMLTGGRLVLGTQQGIKDPHRPHYYLSLDFPQIRFGC